MKRTKPLIELIWFPALILLFTVSALWSAYNLLKKEEARPAFRVSVIVENSSAERWTAFRLGVDQAASEYGVDVTFTATGLFEDPRDQENLVRQELSGNPDGLVIALWDSENANLLEMGTAGGRMVVLVETDGLRESSLVAAVIPSGRDLGSRLGRMILEDSPPAPSVAVITGALDRYLEREMLKGLTETVEEAGGCVKVITGGLTPQGALKTALKADAAAALGDRTLSEAVTVSGDSLKGKLYGIGSSPSNISWLDEGLVRGMVIPDEFTMGYQSVALLARRLSNEIPQMQDLEVGCFCVRSEEVHDPANEKRLFPVVQ